MSELQTFVALAVLIYVLCVIVQALQEVVKSLLNTKASTMAQIITQFMGDHLTLEQVKGALNERGLTISALENFNSDDFRRLLDGITFTDQQISQIPQVVAVQKAGIDQLDQFKDSIAAAYDGARAKFQKLYAANNKSLVIVISFVIVLLLNASVIKIYEILAVNQTMSQAIAGTAPTVISTNQTGQGAGAAQTQDLTQAYENSRTVITSQLQKYPILFRTRQYPCDLGLSQDPQCSVRDGAKAFCWEILGLLIMGGLVSLGAPFWNDVLKGANGLNNALNTGGKKT